MVNPDIIHFFNAKTAQMKTSFVSQKPKTKSERIVKRSVDMWMKVVINY